MTLDYECIDGNFIFNYGYDIFTDEEITLLKSDNHCLRYNYNQDIFTSKEDCYNSVLLQSSKDEGLSCGYFEYNLKYSDGSSETIKSCGIFNKELINYNQLDQKTKETVKNFVTDNTETGKTITSYEVNLSDNDGNSLVYNSLSETVSNENSKEPNSSSDSNENSKEPNSSSDSNENSKEPNSSSNSNMILISKYLLIIMMLLI